VGRERDERREAELPKSGEPQQTYWALRESKVHENPAGQALNTPGEQVCSRLLVPSTNASSPTPQAAHRDQGEEEK
jgi:hypothetical protein